MKKTWCLILSVLLMLSMVACRKEEDEEKSKKTKKNGYEKVIEDIVKSRTARLTVDDMEAMYPEEYWVDYEGEYSPEEMMEEYELEITHHYEWLQDEYGEDVKVSYKIVGKDKWDKEDLEDLQDRLNSYWEIKRKDITEAYTLEVEFTYKGNYDEMTKTEYWDVVKIGDNWYAKWLLEGYDFYCILNGYIGF